MNCFINNGNGYQPVKVVDKLDIEIKPPKTGSNVKPAPAKSVNVTIDSANTDFSFIQELQEPVFKKARSLLRAVPPEIESGDRLILRCPNCDHKVYVQRNGEDLRMSCGGCGIDVIVNMASLRRVKTEKQEA